MEKVKFEPCALSGLVVLPPSKSFAHRAIICCALSGGGKVNNFHMSNDMSATLNFVKALGMDYKIKDDSVTIMNSGKIPKAAKVDCLESGSTLRFIIPIMCALGIECTFVGEGRLPQRPIGIYTHILKGVECKGEGLPYSVKGQLISGDFQLPGNVSSQFITGLMFALPLLMGDSRIILTTALESGAYVDITIEVLRQYGIIIEKTDYGYFVKGDQHYIKTTYRVEGDWSQAAFFMTMGALSGGGIKILGLNMESIQGDREIVQVYRKIGADITEIDKGIFIKKGRLNPIELDVREIPDAVPAIAMCLALCGGRSVITGGERLRIKESDRITSTVGMINAIGGTAIEVSDGMIIDGVNLLKGGSIEGCNDHRIVMAAATVMERSRGDILVSDPYAVNKSYPNFYKDYNELGGKGNVINVGWKNKDFRFRRQSY